MHQSLSPKDRSIQLNRCLISGNGVASRLPKLETHGGCNQVLIKGISMKTEEKQRAEQTINHFLSPEGHQLRFPDDGPLDAGLEAPLVV